MKDKKMTTRTPRKPLSRMPPARAVKTSEWVGSDDRSPVIIRIPPGDKKRLRIMAIEQDTTMQALIERAIKAMVR